MKKYIVIALAALLTASCASRRKAIKEEPDTTTAATMVTADRQNDDSKPQQTIVTNVNKNSQSANGLRARLNLTLASGGRSVGTGGSLKMKRDEIIQISLTAMGLFEVGRMELTPEYVFVQDRVNKQYVQMAWKEIEALRNSGADFYTFQALFWNELFVLGQHGKPLEADFKASVSGKKATLTPAKQHVAVKQQALNFIVDTSEKLLERTSLQTTHGSNLTVSCDYSNFTKLNATKFPQTMTLTINTGMRNLTADFTYSSLQADENLKNIATKPSSSYKRVTLDDIIKQMVK